MNFHLLQLTSNQVASVTSEGHVVDAALGTTSYHDHFGDVNEMVVN